MKSHLAQEFLKAFVKELIKNSVKEIEFIPFPEIKEYPKPLTEGKTKPIRIALKLMIQRAKIIQVKRAMPVQEKQVQRTKPAKMKKKIKYQKSSTSIMHPLSKPRILLSDKTIKNIECAGENKPLLINRSGTVQTTNIMLSNNEISNIAEHFSKKTNTPLPEKGVFRAAVNNILFSAIISNLSGTRFIIQKKTGNYS